MKVEIALLISIVSVVFSAYFGLRNTKRADTSDVEKRAVETATINVKLDSINSSVNDIKYDITSVKKEVKDLANRMIVVEQSTKSMHHRLDEHIEKEN